tara:strand:+ start:128 stop:631 length:504 start_codon:yes stop_codon:yes gene_type:complete
MFNIPHTKLIVEKKLKKLQPLNYNRFRWWRWYEAKNKPLPYKSDFRDKIFNGDFDHSCYMLQAYLCEHMLNELDEECGNDIAKFNEKGAVLKARRKRLWEDYEKDEFDRLQSLYTHFVKYFNIEKEQVIEEALKCRGELIDLYYIIEEKYPKYNIIRSKRGRPKKVI